MLTHSRTRKESIYSSIGRLISRHLRAHINERTWQRRVKAITVAAPQPEASSAGHVDVP